MHKNTIHIEVITLALCSLLYGIPVRGGELTKEAKIERILALTNADAAIEQMLNQAKALLLSQLPAGTTPEDRAKQQIIQEKIMNLMKDMRNKLHPQDVRIYNDIFSDEEINGLLSFYESPAGRALIQKTPLVISQMTIAMQSEMGNLKQEIERIEAAQ